MRNRKWLLPGLIMVAVLGAGNHARASFPIFKSHKHYSSDGQYVLVMIAPFPIEDELRTFVEGIHDEIREVRRTYPQSGLYRNDGSTKPLWTVDWYSSRVILAPDGVHLIRYGSFEQTLDDEALAFFANGILLRTYQVRDLVDDRGPLVETSAGIEWVEDSRFDGNRLEYTVWTKDGNRIVFDVRTGEIVSRFRPTQLLAWTWPGVAGAALLGIVVLLVVWRWRWGRAERLANR